MTPGKSAASASWPPLRNFLYGRALGLSAIRRNGVVFITKSPSEYIDHHRAVIEQIAEITFHTHSMSPCGSVAGIQKVVPSHEAQVGFPCERVLYAIRPTVQERGTWTFRECRIAVCRRGGIFSDASAICEYILSRTARLPRSALAPKFSMKSRTIWLRAASVSRGGFFSL